MGAFCRVAEQVGILTAAYLGATLLADLLKNVGSINDNSDFGRVTLLLPVAFLDGVIDIWTFSAVTKIINQLQSRNQVIKLNMYKNLYRCLLAATILSVFWMLYVLLSTLSLSLLFYFLPPSLETRKKSREAAK